VTHTGETIGGAKHELDTPVLIVDIATMERNIAKMAGRILGRGISWRPHMKGHKVPAIAHLELKAGAIGVTCAKVTEAEVMADAGITDILIANEIVGEAKAARLANLRRRADVKVCVDSEANVRQLSAAAQAYAVELGVLVEVDAGMGRCGVRPGAAVAELAATIDASPGLRFAGLMAWEAHCVRMTDQDQKRACIATAVGLLTESANLCRRRGLDPQIVSCGGTGTYSITSEVPGITEIQAGGGIFHDVYYESCGVDHEFALTVLTTVISRPNATRIVVDAGMKTMSRQNGDPRPLDLAGVNAVVLSAEHARIELAAPNEAVHVGDKIEFIVGYSDATVFLHDELYGTRDGRVETVWPILARGKVR
jgi:D-serine deaminase-like pyridoxal phosphate-dependent protein